MLFGISLTVWIVMLVCAVIAVLYVLIVDKKEGKRAEKRKYLAILMCIAIAVLATVLSKQQAYVGAPMIGLIVSILIVNIVPEGKMSKEFKSGTVFAGKRYLSLGIVFLGATLAFSDLFSAVYALPLVLFNMALAFAVSYLVGRKVLHVSGNTCALVGSGTCVCGGTAIATISPIVKAKEEETAYAMTAIFLFDLLACFMYPYLAIRLGYTPTQFGFLAGTAVNDTSSVTAAASAWDGIHGSNTLEIATIVKLTRTLAIIPITLVLALWRTHKAKTEQSKGGEAFSLKRAFPMFILYFVLASIITTVCTTVGVPAGVFTPLKTLSKFFIVMAMAAIGMNTNIVKLVKTGGKPIFMGFCCWVAIACVSIAMQHLLEFL